MPKILVVDDDQVQRELQGRLLSKLPGAELTYALNGEEALGLIRQHSFDLVVTDLQMPQVDGLQLAETVRQSHPGLPVVVVTSYGSEAIAVNAIKRGASSYVSKSNVVRDLRDIVTEVLNVAGAEKKQRQLLDCLVEHQTHFSLGNDPSLLAPLIGYLQQNLARMGIADEARRMRIGIALQEAMTNAIFHGNLEVSSALRQGGAKAYFEQAEARKHQEPYGSRRVDVVVRESRDQAIYKVRDQGPGFNVAGVPNPLDPANLEKESGRGLFLIHSFMDEVSYNSTGNEITMTVRKDTETLV